MKSSSNRYLVPSLLLAATLVVVLNAAFAFHAVSKLLDSEYWVEHTWKVINQVEQVMGTAKDAETGNRGYLITGDEAYLEPYNQALHDLPIEVAELRSLTHDNPSQQQRIGQIQAVIDQRLELLKQGNELRRSGNADAVQILVVSGTGKQQMDHLRTLADNAEAEERRLLATRTEDAQTNGSRSRWAVVIASGLDFMLIVFMFRYLAKERGLRIAGEITARNLAASRAELVERNQEINARNAEINARNEEINARNEEINALNASLEQRVALRTAELEATNRELEAFSYSVSHDLRAPLRTIDGFSLALEEDYAEAIDNTGRDYILRVRTGVQRMGGLIDALLQLSRISRADITRDTFDISALATSVASALREENPGQDITFTIQPGLTADGDPKLIQVALENLLGNAVKFSSKKEASVIDFGWDPEKNAFFVRDNGAGFDMHYADKLFNAFNRLHGDKDFKGSGIGLATVSRVIRRHHGKIWADSVIEHGTTFWFTLG